jgi:hypothetical protein
MSRNGVLRDREGRRDRHYGHSLGKLCPAAAFGTDVRAMFDRTPPEACLALVQQFSQVKEKMAWCWAAPALDTKLKSLFRCGGLEVAESAFPVQVAVG